MDTEQYLHEPRLATLEPETTAVVRGTVRLDALPAFFDESFPRLFETLGRQQVQPAGPPFARYEGEPTETIEVELGVPTSRPIEPDGEVVPGELPGGEVATGTHVGSYDHLRQSYDALARWIGEQGRVPSSGMWEVYVTEPGPDVDPSTLRTDIYWPLADGGGQGR